MNSYQHKNGMHVYKQLVMGKNLVTESLCDSNDSWSHVLITVQTRFFNLFFSRREKVKARVERESFHKCERQRNLLLFLRWNTSQIVDISTPYALRLPLSLRNNTVTVCPKAAFEELFKPLWGKKENCAKPKRGENIPRVFVQPVFVLFIEQAGHYTVPLWLKVFFHSFEIVT